MEEKVHSPLNSYAHKLGIKAEPRLSIEAQENGYVPDLSLPRINYSPEKNKTNPSVTQKIRNHKINLTKEIIGKLSKNEEQDIIVIFEDSDIFSKFRSTNWQRTSRDEKKIKLKNLVAGLLDLKQQVLSLLSKHSVKLKQDYSHLPISLIKVKNISALNAIAQSPKIKAIYQDDINHLNLDQSLPLINQPEAFTLGVIGEGTTVAILDTGLDYSHPAFGSCVSPGVPGDCKVVYVQDFTALDDGELDAHGHGTNVSGIVSGVAPGTKLAGLDVFTGGGAYTSHIIAAIDWIVANQSTYNIVAANLSLGSSSNNPTECTDSWATIPFERLRAVDVLPIVASGNDSYKNGLANPACAPGAISVGAIYDNNFGTLGWMGCTDYSAIKGSVTCFSNSADYLTLLAPGAMITSAGLKMSGTSMAAPHVAGAVAVLRGNGAFPGDTLNATIEHLTNTGTLTIDSANGLSHPLINLEAAFLDGLPGNPPEIQSFSPSIGREKTSITISGNNFFNVTAVKFGGVDADSYDVISSNEINAIVGKGNTGSVSVVAQNGTDSKAGFVFNPSQLISLTNIPESATLTSTNETLNISVQGQYSDGASSIVTASSTFYSTDSSILTVDERGTVTVKGEGTVNVIANIGELTSVTQINVDITSIVDRELEPNNSIINANPVDIGESVYRGNLSDSSDIDNYIITIPSSSVLTILIKPVNDTYTGGVVRASIVDSEGTIYAAKKISSDTSGFANLSAALINPGTYYLRIDKLGYYSVFTKDYEFLIQSNDDPIFFVTRELEPNNSFGEAMLYSADAGTIYGQLSSTEDIDVFAYDLSTGVFLLHVKPENTIYDGGTIVVSIQDSSGIMLVSKEVRSDEPIPLTLTSRIDTYGRYYVVVNRKAYYTVFTKDYELSPQFSTDENLFSWRESEPNNSFGEAMLYSADAGTIYGQLSSTEDIDVFAYDLTTGVFLLHVKPENPIYDGGTIVVSIQDSSGSVLVSKEVRSDEPIPLTLTSSIGTYGRYYVVVNRKASYTIFTKDYQLLVNFDPGDLDNDGVLDPFDNCPDIPNTNQSDSDEDGAGNACDDFPNNPNYSNNSDSDGLPDEWEQNYFSDLDEINSGDPDGDGLTNYNEFIEGTNPNNADSDNDGLSDGVEIEILGTNPLMEDTDNNSILDCDEDNDGDGFTNIEEIECNSDPGNPNLRCSKGLPWLMLLLD